jgi:hypothetical protein
MDWGDGMDSQAIEAFQELSGRMKSDRRGKERGESLYTDPRW